MAQSTPIPTSIDSAPAKSTASVAFPPCARSCLSLATSSLPCADTDSQCLCLHASTVKTSVETCLTASGTCSAADKTAASLYYNNLCQSLGLPTDSGSSSLSTAALVTATGSPSPVPTTAPASTHASSTSAAVTLSSHSNTLSVPAIAGIAGGSAFLLAVIISVLMFLYIRRHSKDDILIVDSEQRPNPMKDERPKSNRRSALFTLEPPSPPEKDEIKRAMYENRIASGATFDSRPTLTNNSFTWYNKKEAEISTTSLISMPRNVLTPVPKSPAVTEFSDVASLYSATSSEVSEESSRPPSTIPEPPPAPSKRQSRVVVSQHIFNPPKVSFSQPRPGTSHSTAERPPRLDVATVPKLEEIELDQADLKDRRVSLNPLGQNPSHQPGGPSTVFNFELPRPETSHGFGNSFMNMKEFER